MAIPVPLAISWHLGMSFVAKKAGENPWGLSKSQLREDPKLLNVRVFPSKWQFKNKLHVWESIKQTNPCRVKSCPLPDTGKNRSSSEGDDRADRGGHCFKETTTTKLGLVWRLVPFKLCYLWRNLFSLHSLFQNLMNFHSPICRKVYVVTPYAFFEDMPMKCVFWCGS